jgi:hypothetical protein
MVQFFAFLVHTHPPKMARHSILFAL